MLLGIHFVRLFFLLLIKHDSQTMDEPIETEDKFESRVTLIRVDDS